MAAVRPGSVTRSCQTRRRYGTESDARWAGPGCQVSSSSRVFKFHATILVSYHCSVAGEVSVIQHKRLLIELNRNSFWLFAFLNMLNARQHFWIVCACVKTQFQNESLTQTLLRSFLPTNSLWATAKLVFSDWMAYVIARHHAKPITTDSIGRLRNLYS